MAIIIPSKNIYEMKNPKVRNNAIDTIEYEANSPNLVEEFDVNVYNKDVVVSSEFQWEDTFNNIAIAPNQNVSSYYIYTNAKYIEKKFNIYKGEKDKEYIDRIDKWDFSIKGIKYEYGISGFPYFLGEHRRDLIVQEATPRSKSEQVFDLSFMPQKYGGFTGVENKSIINLIATYKKYYEFGYSIIGYYIEDKMEAPYNGVFTGTRTIYEAQTITITFNGKKTELVLNETSDKISNVENGKYPISFSKNELIQTTSYYKDRGTNSLNYNYGKTLEQYSKGKETATLLLSISEYYDEEGNLVISTKNNEFPMLFDVGDIVIPMVFSSTRADVTMSKYQNGNPKKFEVTQVEPIDDGAIWQRLTLQEYTETE